MVMVPVMFGDVDPDGSVVSWETVTLDVWLVVSVPGEGLGSVSSVLFGVCEEVEGVGDNDTSSGLTAVVFCCVVVVVVESCCVSLVVVTVEELTLYFVVIAKVVGFAELVVISVICSVTEEVVVPAKEQTA